MQTAHLKIFTRDGYIATVGSVMDKVIDSVVWFAQCNVVEELQDSIMEWHSCSKGVAIQKNKLDKTLLKPRLISVCSGWRALISKMLNNTTAPLAREAYKDVQMALHKDGIA